MAKWKLLSLVLALALAVSLGFNVYQGFYADDGATGGSSSSDDAGGWMNYTFTWDPEAQDIVNGTFRIDVSIRFENVTYGNVTTETFILVVKANDDDYYGSDYLGLALDMNQNGVIEYGLKDYPLLLYASNRTVTDVSLHSDGRMFPPEIFRDDIYTCTFDPDEGYTFGPYRFAAGELMSNIDPVTPYATYIPMLISFVDTNCWYPDIGRVCFELLVYTSVKAAPPSPTYNVQITNVNATVVDQPVTVEGRIEPAITFKRVTIFFDGSGTDVLTDKDGNFKKIYEGHLPSGVYAVYATLDNSTSNVVQVTIGE
jgi:hypothetical protein